MHNAHAVYRTKAAETLIESVNDNGPTQAGYGRVVALDNGVMLIRRDHNTDRITLSHDGDEWILQFQSQHLYKDMVQVRSASNYGVVMLARCFARIYFTDPD